MKGLLLALIVVALLGCGSDAPPIPSAETYVPVSSAEANVPSSSPEVIRVSVYPLDSSPSGAASFVGNDAIILGTVTSIGAARWNTANTSDGALRFIFRPVAVHVDEVLGGAVQEGEITVRRIGGQVDNVRYVRDDLPSDDQVQPGTHLLIFLGPIVKTDDGLAARTPNFWYLVRDSVAATVDGRYQARLSDFRQIIAAAQARQDN